MRCIDTQLAGNGTPTTYIREPARAGAHVDHCPTQKGERAHPHRCKWCTATVKPNEPPYRHDLIARPIYMWFVGGPPYNLDKYKLTLQITSLQKIGRKGKLIADTWFKE